MNKQNKFTKSYFLIGQKAVVVDDSDNILLLRRSAKTPRPGGWDFPGGGLDSNENAVVGIKREIKEEAGISVMDLRPITVTSCKEGKDNVILIYYSAKTRSKQLKLSWEHDQYQWFTKKEIVKLKMPANMKKIIKMYYVEKSIRKTI